MKYAEPTTIVEALALAASPPAPDAGTEEAGTRFLAGGTDLLLRLRQGLVKPPALVVSLGRVEALRHITVTGDTVRLGPTTTVADILFSRALCEAAPVLPEVADSLAGPQIRNLATLGGNIVNASPSGDLIGPLLLLDATLVLSRLAMGAPAGEALRVSDVTHREVLLHSFFTGPGATVMEPGELLTEIRLPRPQAGYRVVWEALDARPAMECSLATVGVGACVDPQGRLRDVRVAFGALAPTPLRGRATEAALEGKAADEATIGAACSAAAGELRPISDVRASAEYRRALARALLARGIRRLASGEARRPRPAWLGFRETLAAPRPTGESLSPTRERLVRFEVNGEITEVLADPLTSLADLLRNRLGLLGTKVGCGAGECGTCTVLLDGQAVNACLVLGISCHGATIGTIEGLRSAEGLSPLQRAFVDHGAVQCGFCTPGMIMEAQWLRGLGLPLHDDLIRRGMEGNLCRCTGYVKILDAIGAAPVPQAPQRGGE